MIRALTFSFAGILYTAEVEILIFRITKQTVRRPTSRAQRGPAMQRSVQDHARLLPYNHRD